MDPKFFRKYADIITEAEQPEMLSEGIVDTIVQKAKGIIGKISPQTLSKVTALVSNSLGKPANQITMADLTISNIKKIAAANSQGLAEANDQDLRYDYRGIETAPIPGSKAQNVKSSATVGGVLGGLIPLLGGVSIGTIGLPILLVAAACAIVFAILGAKGAGADYAQTGKRDVSKADVGYSSSGIVKRDRRLGPAQS